MCALKKMTNLFSNILFSVQLKIKQPHKVKINDQHQALQKKTHLLQRRLYVTIIIKKWKRAINQSCYRRRKATYTIKDVQIEKKVFPVIHQFAHQFRQYHYSCSSKAARKAEELLPHSYKKSTYSVAGLAECKISQKRRHERDTHGGVCRKGFICPLAYIAGARER